MDNRNNYRKSTQAQNRTTSTDSQNESVEADRKRLHQGWGSEGSRFWDGDGEVGTLGQRTFSFLRFLSHQYFDVSLLYFSSVAHGFVCQRSESEILPCLSVCLLAWLWGSIHFGKCSCLYVYVCVCVVQCVGGWLSVCVCRQYCGNGFCVSLIVQRDETNWTLSVSLSWYQGCLIGRKQN